MPAPARPSQIGVEAGSPPSAVEGGGRTPAPSCPLSIADGHVCGCLNPPVPDAGKGLISVISSDAAVRRSLVLLLEAEGLTARAFCTVPAFLSVIDGVPGPQRHCIVMEEEQARWIDAEWLARQVARESRPISIVVLTAAPSHRPYLPLSQGGISFVDPFGVDDVLRTIRGALAMP